MNEIPSASQMLGEKMAAQIDAEAVKSIMKQNADMAQEITKLKAEIESLRNTLLAIRVFTANV